MLIFYDHRRYTKLTKREIEAPLCSPMMNERMQVRTIEKKTPFMPSIVREHALKGITRQSDAKDVQRTYNDDVTNLNDVIFH